MKELVGKEIARRVNSGEIIGVGTGSTVDVALQEIARRVKQERVQLQVVPSSYETALQCKSIGLAVLSPLYEGELSWGFDGADEIDPTLRLIKGHGGALLQEKILATKCKRWVIIAEKSKLVTELGEKFKVPVEVIPEAIFGVRAALKELGAQEIVLRQSQGKHGPVITERGNILLDVQFKKIERTHERDIKSIVGVVENGIFSNYADEVIVAKDSGVFSLSLNESGRLSERKL